MKQNECDFYIYIKLTFKGTYENKFQKSKKHINTDKQSGTFSIPFLVWWTSQL